MRSNVVHIDSAKLADAVQTLPFAANIDAFLAYVEKRAYRSAMFTTRNEADALDIVQDAMVQLVQYYRERSAHEWPLLFQRILQNRIMDWHRAQTTRRRWFWQAPVAHDEDADVIADISDERDINPATLLQNARDIERVLQVIESLPLRQRQAFLLRNWEGLDVEDTASAMQCSEGAVKSHFFRAMQAIKQALE